jgi:hypothetical protein
MVKLAFAGICWLTQDTEDVWQNSGNDDVETDEDFASGGDEVDIDDTSDDIIEEEDIDEEDLEETGSAGRQLCITWWLCWLRRVSLMISDTVDFFFGRLADRKRLNMSYQVKSCYVKTVEICPIENSTAGNPFGFFREHINYNK